MNFLVPGKTYLVGEYSVLLNGSAIGVATNPAFQVDYAATDSLIFHQDSPAGKYLARQGETRKVSITDPYQFGGFGKSTAEYFAAIIPDLLKSEQKFNSILAEYRSLHQGSGMDLAFQYFGNVCLADPQIKFYQTFNWHFSNLDFCILSTGLKINTHEHLSQLDLTLIRDLPALSDQITRVYAENKEFEFLSLMKDWCKELESRKLTHEHSLELKRQLEEHPAIKLAKPCGALGADVIIIFFAKSQRNEIHDYLQDRKFQICAYSADLAGGVKSQIVRYKKENEGKPNVD